LSFSSGISITPHNNCHSSLNNLCIVLHAEAGY
jgi:hypothetical protein